MASHLKHVDFNFTLFHDGDEAFESIAKGDGYDLAVLDCVLPGKTGVEITAELHRVHPTTPIVVVTSELQFASQTDQISSIRCWVLKPVSMDRFVDVVERIWNESSNPA